MKGVDALILCYHRVADTVDDPFQLCVTPANFAAHLDEIARYGEPSTLAQLSVPSRRPRVVVTFDDGYVDNLTDALPIAEAKSFPITVFVTSGVLGSDTGFWWDRLGILLKSRPPEAREIRLLLSKGTVRVGLGSPKAGEDLQAVRHHLLPLPVAEIHRVLDAVSEEWGTPSMPPPDARSLTRSELVQLASSAVVTIGAHTVDHIRLRDFSAQDQLQTISSSKEDLERVIGGAVSHFAYPYGGADSFDDRSAEAVRSAGFETACTTIPGNVRSGSDSYRLPRRMVMNWSRIRFWAGVQRWRLVPQR